MDGSGYVVLDTAYHRIQIFNSAGNFVKKWENVWVDYDSSQGLAIDRSYVYCLPI